MWRRSFLRGIEEWTHDEGDGESAEDSERTHRGTSVHSGGGSRGMMIDKIYFNIQTHIDYVSTECRHDDRGR